jgi:hypothetical protein
VADVPSQSSFDDTPLNNGVPTTFVVRIWSSEGEDALRGHIQHVRTRKRAYFATSERLMQFIQDHLQGPDGDPCQS